MTAQIGIGQALERSIDCLHDCCRRVSRMIRVEFICQSVPGFSDLCTAGISINHQGSHSEWLIRPCVKSVERVDKVMIPAGINDEKRQCDHAVIIYDQCSYVMMSMRTR